MVGAAVAAAVALAVVAGNRRNNRNKANNSIIAKIIIVAKLVATTVTIGFYRMGVDEQTSMHAQAHGGAGHVPSIQPSSPMPRPCPTVPLQSSHGSGAMYPKALFPRDKPLDINPQASPYLNLAFIPFCNLF